MEFPNATKHPVNKELLVAAAIGTRPADKERVGALAAAGVDAIIIDSSQGDSVFQHEMIKWSRQVHRDRWRKLDDEPTLRVKKMQINQFENGVFCDI